MKSSKNDPALKAAKKVSRELELLTAFSRMKAAVHDLGKAMDALNKALKEVTRR